MSTQASPEGLLEAKSRLDAKAAAMGLARPLVWPDQGMGHIRPVVHDARNETRFVLVGDHVLAFPEAMPFPLALIRIALDFLGPEWVDRQARRRRLEVSLIVDWLLTVREMYRSNRSWGLTHPIEATISFGFMIFALANAGLLSGPSGTRIRDRLRDPVQFQGAYFEIIMARLFLQAGFGVEWDEPSSTGKHVEFFATYPTTAKRIAVEAKAKHRGGVFSADGPLFDAASSHEAALRRLVRSGLSKSPKDQLFLFVDANLPTPDYKRLLGGPYFSGAKEDSFSVLLVITNLLDGYGEGWVQPRDSHRCPPLPPQGLVQEYSALLASLRRYPAFHYEFVPNHVAQTLAGSVDDWPHEWFPERLP